jgi:hypothetical protein
MPTSTLYCRRALDAVLDYRRAGRCGELLLLFLHWQYRVAGVGDPGSWGQIEGRVVWILATRQNTIQIFAITITMYVFYLSESRES